ncbi:aminotransferase class IV [Roseivirga sp.]|uniref:aminotransferase class IV n=1 Tax=Roseivirga sp. TaxID=1964215 RepID=UPI002B2718E9|nr:aminotransferase class IV [Roseivirga sp.]
MKPIHFFNGDFVPKESITFSIDDVGVLRGFGIFDYFKVYNGAPAFMEAHLNRFENSARLLGMEIPFSRKEIESAIRKLIEHNRFPLSGVKVLMTGGASSDGFSAGKPNLIITNTAVSETNPSFYTEGVSVMTHQFSREMPEVKSTNYATAVRLESLWKQKGHIDALYHDGQYISEVSRSNVFLVEGNKIITNEEGVLPGITRMNVVNMAPELGFEVEIRPIALAEVLAAEELFMTSTNKRVMPVVKIDDQEIASGIVGAKTKILMEGYAQLMAEETKQPSVQN